MSYQYQTEKPKIFTEEGQVIFLAIRDKIDEFIEEAGAVRMDKIMVGVGAPDAWTVLACVDRLVELNEIVEVSRSNCWGQHRIFTKKHDYA